MAIKAGQIIHTGNGTVVIDRIQTAGPGSLNIPIDRIYELGNYKSVGTIRDTPDLTFSLESFDVSTEIEEFLTGGEDPATGIDLGKTVPVDIASQFKAGITATSPYSVIASVAIPFLYLESMSYRFGLRDNASQSASLRGDSIFYNPGPTYVQEVAGSGTAGQTVATTNPAYQVAEGDARRVLSVTAAGQRLNFGADYSESYGTVTSGAAITTVTLEAAVATTDKIRIVYSSPTALSYLQAVHPSATVKPAGVRGRDIEVYVGGYDPLDIPGSQVNKVTSVQAVTADWRATLEKDEEFGNYYAVGQDFDVPAVNGTIDIKPRTPAELAALVRKVQGISDATKVLGPNSAVPLELDIVIKNPNDNGAVIKRLHSPDARFTLPGFQGRVQQKLTQTLNWESDEGTLLVFSA